MTDKNEYDIEYMLTLFSPNNNKNSNRGFFTIVEATPLSYNSIGGYYEIKGSKIELSKLLLLDSDKNEFINYFNLDEQYLEEDNQENYYKFVFDYRSNNITSKTLEYKLVS